MTQLIYNPILALVKNAALIFFLRLGWVFERLRLFILSLLVLNNLMMFGIFFTVVFQCVPIKKTFYPELPGTCIDLPPFFIATAALTILTDILVLIIPTWLLWDLRMKPKKKLATIFLLSLGALVTSISVYRMWYLIRVYYGPPDPDPTYSVAGTSSAIEVNLAIIAACGPFLKPLIARIFPNFLERDTLDDHAGGLSGPLSWGDRFRTQPAKLGPRSSFESDLELQSYSATPGGGGLRGASGYGRPLAAWDEGEDDTKDSRGTRPSHRRVISKVTSMIVVGPPSPEVESVARPQRGRGHIRTASGITRQVTVQITYSPREDGHHQEL